MRAAERRRGLEEEEEEEGEGEVFSAIGELLVGNLDMASGWRAGNSAVAVAAVLPT